MVFSAEISQVLESEFMANVVFSVTFDIHEPK